MKMLTCAVVAVMLLAGCSSSPAVEEKPPASAPTENTEVSASPSADAERAPACLDVPDALLQAIAEGANDLAITPRAGAAVRSADFDEVYMIAMQFSAAGGDDEVGVWASNSLDAGGGIIVAVDGFAQSFTEWPSEVDGTKFTVAVDGADEAAECLRG